MLAVLQSGAGVGVMIVATFTSCKAFHNTSVVGFPLHGQGVGKQRCQSKDLDLEVGYGFS